MKSVAKKFGTKKTKEKPSLRNRKEGEYEVGM
jgi:hypothetical protein